MNDHTGQIFAREHPVVAPGADDLAVRLGDFIVETFLYGETERRPGPDDSLIENDVIDSTGVLELVAYLEAEFGFAVEDEEILPENFDSIAKLQRYIASKTPAPDAMRGM